MHLLYIVWDPVKYLDLGFFKLHFYSVMWIVAFILGFYIMKRIYKNEGQSEESLDSLFIYSVLGIMLGARLGHVIFYQPELITEDFFSIFLPFKFKGGFEFTGFQGLASHGAAIAMIISMYLYNKKILKKSVLWILDRVVVPVALGAVFVRIGNFINSEIVGKFTNSDFGVVFKQLSETEPRHPAQLYEAFCYIFVFLILFYFYWKTKKSEQQGFLFGLFLVLLWTIRFFVEFVKKAQVDAREDWFLNTGQWLSIPFVLIGLYFMFAYKPKKELN
ncbi:prolipoprotein diacylglyceryl transferase [Winogradskyella sp. SYSU M77433]|uniref:prolipoprotein diacylglyceryl transferase n=1 Tax=Winogradskyella sp. SYSU M77433 TaxID=3042722 RepID=UPI0024809A12|nr:prolipoprotein diacylglyceryl transferase [Winogradskyella sp. SYSU M77433]MDH7914437.1 prolipoprotein diacylglyceryl transferase [Winogradskyella sp. SYSU M77433]|tara:strand:- start:666 stop:1490 length:825 start_codon:yes stop_codon:yes gene_type:complete